MLLSGCSSDSDLTVVSYGAGSYQDSHLKAFLNPFTKETGHPTRSVAWNAEYGKLRAMIESGAVTWDVVDVTSAILSRGMRDKILAPVKLKMDTSSFLPGTIHSHGVGNVYWATVLAYDAQMPGRAPASWADMFDLRNFPGPRALYDDPRGNIEFALLASGAHPAELYPFTPDKLKEAFKLLSTIRDSVRVWWSDGTQPVQLLLTQQVVMSSAWSGRLFASPQARERLRYPWDGAALELDYWVVPKGSPHESIAIDFIEFASRPACLAEQAKLIAYGPANKAALAGLPPELLAQLPTAEPNFSRAFVVNADVWENDEDELRSRWLNWKATGVA
jgi:putative spermidine/putrescine transport system substrate-binding protein